MITEADDQPPAAQLVAVLSYGYWERHLGGERSALGKTVILQDRSFTIVGVAPRGLIGLAPCIPADIIAYYDNHFQRARGRGRASVFRWQRQRERVFRGECAQRVATEVVAGSYNVNADCTASLALTDASGNTENFAGVVVGQGTSALIFADGCGRGVSASMQRIYGFCQTSDLSGAFGIQYSVASGGVSSTAA